MTVTKFTPGPWVAKRIEAENFIYNDIMSGASGEKIVEDQSCISDANAQLIAAAPELYEALEMVSGALTLGDDGPDPGCWADLSSKEVQKIFDALAKARGDG